MIKLNEDFFLNQFGLDVRLVRESDAAFIYSLRSDKVLTQHIHGFDGVLEDQINWIKLYKEREKEGGEYYFIYEKKGVPFGVNRIYNIANDEGTTGSWICIPGTNPIDTLATAILLYDIFFDIIHLTKAHYDTRKNNTKALRVNSAFGGTIINETELDFFFELLPEQYHFVRDRLLRIWHIK